MGSLYRPTYTTYVGPDGKARTPDGKRITSSTPGAVRKEGQSDYYWGEWTDAGGKQHKQKLAKSKDIASRMLKKLEGDGQLESVGISDPFGEHRGRSLLDHLDDYRRFLAAKENNPTHIQKTCSQCRAIIEGCGFGRMDDVEAPAVVEFLAGLRSGQDVTLEGRRRVFTLKEIADLLKVDPSSVRRTERRGLLSGGEGRGLKRRYPREAVERFISQRSRGASVETTNHYLTAFKGFLRWMARNRRAPFDPLSHESLLNADLDVRHERRALTGVELGAFLDATGGGLPFRGLTGPDRIILYSTAARTGLRAAELASLSPSSFHFDQTPPTVTVEAAYSKHKRKDVLPLRADLAELLRAFCASKPAGELLWPGSWPEVGAEMIRHDLEAAGIPYRDEHDRVLDFHGLRHTFLTHLAESGVHPKAAQVLARHSTITLTMDRYTHMQAVDVAGDLEKLPSLAKGKQAEEPARKLA